MHRVGARVDVPGSAPTSVGGPAPTKKDVDRENGQVTLYQMERILLAEGFCIPTVLSNVRYWSEC